ncbi:MAG: hypothetical protein AAF405_00255 [Pseudomonadota bacterium]
MIGLTRKQTDLLAFLRSYHAREGVMPIYEQMMAHMGLASKNSIYRLLTALEERGRIRRLHGRARAIEILSDAHLCPHCGKDIAHAPSQTRSTVEQHERATG